MHKLTLIVSALAGALALAAAAGATPPEHGTFTAHDQFVDTETCAFPIVGDYVFTNDNVTDAANVQQAHLKNVSRTRPPPAP